jgi:glycosyltransferase involved in cell wall biosynthesis
MLTWEYPPRIVGGISRHVEGLSTALASMGHEVHVITLDFPGAQKEEQRGSLYLHRVSVDLPAPDFHSWVLLFNHVFEKRAGQLAKEYGPPDVVHSHDWLTVSSGVDIKHLLRTPLVMTFHSTEASRSGNSKSAESAMVEGLEWWGSFEAARVIAVSSWMRDEVVSLFKIPRAKAVEIPNAVDLGKFEMEVDTSATRRRWGVGDGGKLITAVGRLTAQKGFDNLIRAYPAIRQAVPSSRLLVVGEGYMRSELEGLAAQLRVRDSTAFAGFIDDADLVRVLKSSDVVAVPSRFEPFGIIALEAMAAGAPVVVSKVGGLAEIVEDSVDGLQVDPENPGSIAEAAVRILSDRGLASRLAEKGRAKAKAYSWEGAAVKTLEAYEGAMRESRYE